MERPRHPPVLLRNQLARVLRENTQLFGCGGEGRLAWRRIAGPGWIHGTDQTVGVERFERDLLRDG